MDEREFSQEEIKKKAEQIINLTRQIENCDKNITGLIAQKTRHMDRRDLYESEKAELESQLAALPEEGAGV